MVYCKFSCQNKYRHYYNTINKERLTDILSVTKTDTPFQGMDGCN